MRTPATGEHCARVQETRKSGQAPLLQQRTLIPAQDLEHGDVSGSSQLLEEVGKLLEAYWQAILNSDS